MKEEEERDSASCQQKWHGSHCPGMPRDKPNSKLTNSFHAQVFRPTSGGTPTGRCPSVLLLISCWFDQGCSSSHHFPLASNHHHITIITHIATANGIVHWQIYPFQRNCLLRWHWNCFWSKMLSFKGPNRYFNAMNVFAGLLQFQFALPQILSTTLTFFKCMNWEQGCLSFLQIIYRSEQKLPLVD